MASVTMRKVPNKMEFILKKISQSNIQLNVGVGGGPEVQKKAYYNDFVEVTGIYDGVEEYGVLRPFLTPVMRREKAYVYDYIKSRFVSLDFDNTKDIFNDLGKYLTNQVKNEILYGEHHKNADSTIERKGFDEPLVETGELYDNVGFAVREKKNKYVLK